MIDAYEWANRLDKKVCLISAASDENLGWGGSSGGVMTNAFMQHFNKGEFVCKLIDDMQMEIDGYINSDASQWREGTGNTLMIDVQCTRPAMAVLPMFSK